MKKLLLAVLMLLTSFYNIYADAWTSTYKNCYSVNHKKRHTDSKVSFYSPTATNYWGIIGFNDANGNGYVPDAYDTPIYGWITKTAGWHIEDQDYDRACGANSAHCKSLYSFNFPSPTGFKTGIGEAWNNSGGATLTIISPHSQLVAGANENTPAPASYVEGRAEARISFDNDITENTATFKLKGGNLVASDGFETVVKVMLCIKNGESKDLDGAEIISESSITISRNGISKSGIFNSMALEMQSENGLNSVELPMTSEFSIYVPADFRDNEDLCIVVYTDGKYSETVSNKSIGTSKIDATANEILSVYPNPSNGRDIKINFSNNSNSNEFDVNVFDVVGKLIFTKKQTSTSLDLHTLPNGTYILEVDNKQSIYKTKIQIIN